MLKGWKTIIFAVSLFILGGIESAGFSGAVGGCIFEFGATQPDTCTLPAWLLMPIAVVVVALRFATTSPVFKK